MEDSDNQNYCLKWNNFQNNFMSQFEALKEEQDFVDVTLSCYGQSIKAHKVVLSASSPYLKNIFKENPCKHPVVILDNLSFDNLEAVIQFVYTGEVYVKQTELPSFLKAAETLQIKGLTETSANQSFVETSLPPVDRSLNPASYKREAEVDSEMRKSNKKIPRRISGGLTRDFNEFKEQDCFSNIDIKQEKNFTIPSPETLCEMEPNLNIEERGFTFSSGDEDYGANELKKPHWLDPRSCPMCNRVYSNLSNLRQHMKLIHNPRLVRCKLCYKTFKTDLYLRRHLIGYHEVNLNGNNMGPIKNKIIIDQFPPEMPNIKPEPEAYNEVFNENEMYKNCV